MKIYYENDYGKLYHGDCLDVMQEMIKNNIKVDAVITDPPYGMQFNSNRRTIKHKAIVGDKEFDWLPEYSNMLFKILKDGAHSYNFCSWHNIEQFKITIGNVTEIKNILIWAKNNTGMGDLKRQYAPKYEMIIYSVKCNL